MNKNITGILKSWVYDAEYNIVWGYIYNDINKRFKDGLHIHTSTILSKNPKSFKKGTIIKTRNSTYLLEEPFKGE